MRVDFDRRTGAYNSGFFILDSFISRVFCAVAKSIIELRSVGGDEATSLWTQCRSS